MLKHMLIAVIIACSVAACEEALAEDMGIVVLQSLVQLHRTQINTLQREGDYHLKLAKQHMEAARAIEVQPKTPQREKRLAAELAIVQQHLTLLKLVEQDIIASSISFETLTKELGRILPPRQGM